MPITVTRLEQLVHILRPSKKPRYGAVLVRFGSQGCPACRDAARELIQGKYERQFPRILVVFVDIDQADKPFVDFMTNQVKVNGIPHYEGYVWDATRNRYQLERHAVGGSALPMLQNLSSLLP